MAPLPDNLTRRVYFDYVSAGPGPMAQNHTCMWRHAFDAVDAGAVAIQQKFLDFVTHYGVAGWWVGWAITGVRVSEGGTNFSTPVPVLPALAAFTGTAPQTGVALSAAAIESRWVGRSPLSGRKTSFSLYGRSYTVLVDFRDSASVGTGLAVGLLNANTAPRLVAPDNTVATWYPYVNQNYNSYWESELRV